MEIRLNRYLARCGLGSRRACEDLIVSGRVTINEICVTELGSKVDPQVDIVTCDGVVAVLPEQSCTLMLHKPAGYVSTMCDPQGRLCVSNLIPIDEYPSLYPVGRLDFDTTGLLLFTTIGSLGHALLHPKHHVEKTYFALVDGIPTSDQIETLRRGVQLDDGLTLPAKVSMLRGVRRQSALEAIGDDALSHGRSKQSASKGTPVQDTSAVLEISLSEGKKRQVKRMCSAIHHPVIALHRPKFGSLSLDGLERGAWRFVRDEELVQLMSCAGISLDEESSVDAVR